MNNYRKCLLISLALPLGLAAAQAADLPTRKPGPPAPVVYDPGAPLVWSGPFVALQGGYAWDGEELFVPGVSSVPYSVERHGEFGGVAAGYNYQTGNLVLGVVADYNLSNVTGGAAIDGAYISTNNVHNFGSIDAKIGYAFNRWLVYGVGGVGFAEIEHTMDVPAVAFDKFSAFQTGYNVGGGVQYAFDKNWSMFGEYRYYHFPPRDFNAMLVIGPHHTIETLSTLRVGVAYRFGG